MKAKRLDAKIPMMKVHIHDLDSTENHRFNFYGIEFDTINLQK